MVDTASSTPTDPFLHIPQFLLFTARNRTKMLLRNDIYTGMGLSYILSTFSEALIIMAGILFFEETIS
jgi:hypothetical protein